jgi:putative transposase
VVQHHPHRSGTDLRAKLVRCFARHGSILLENRSLRETRGGSKGQQTMVAAGLRQAFLQAGTDDARKVWRQMADQFRSRWPKLGKLLDESEHDVLAYMGFPAQHRVKLHSTNPLERLNKEVKRRADVVGIFPSEQSILRLIGAVLPEANDE